MKTLAALALTLLCGGAAAADARATLALLQQQPAANARSPLQQAERALPGIAPAEPASRTLQAEVAASVHGADGLSLHGNVLLARRRPAGGAGTDASRVNELHAALDLGAWQLAAGRKVLGWDVGHAFRPNDLVQQEARRTLFTQTPQGRPLLMLEHFDADSAWAVVAVNPLTSDGEAIEAPGGSERALAARVYRRLGSLDLHGFARQGRHSGSSLGAAVSWVAGDAVELRGSLRVFERHARWWAGDAGNAPLRSNPWLWRRAGAGAQALLGGTWTGDLKQSVMLEAWHDGAALPASAWRDWSQRNAALAGLAADPSLGAPAAGNLAWQATPLQSSGLHRDNLFLRLAWQPQAWTLSLDILGTPADRGRILTAQAQWQGDRWRLQASWREYGGPAGAVFAQLPQRRVWLLAAELAL